MKSLIIIIKMCFLRVLLILYICSFFLVFSCTSTTASLFDTLGIRVEHYENPEYTLTLDYPVDWYVKEQDGLFLATVPSFNLVEEEGVGLAILRYPEKDLQSELENMTLDNLIKSFMDEIDVGYKDKGDIVIGGIDARQAGFSISQEKKISGEISVLSVNRYVYFFLIMVNPPSLMTEYREVFKAVYESVEFTGKEES